MKNKNPISILNEMEMAGEIRYYYMPTSLPNGFKATITIEKDGNNYTASYKAKDKKEAKRKAAAAALKKIGIETNYDPGAEPVSAVSFLFAQAQKKIHGKPIFVLISEEGSGNSKTFTYKVNVDGESATGSGKSKKVAKGNAAQNLLNQPLT